MPNNFNNCIGCPYCQQIHLPQLQKSLVNSPLSIDIGNNADTLLVFQSPGTDEWGGGVLTVSGNRIPIDSKNRYSAAARMRNSMARKGVVRTDYDITEAVQCFPGKKSNGRDKRPSVNSMMCCLHHLVNDLSVKKYNKIVAFGAVAYQMTTQAVGIVNTNNVIKFMQPLPIFARHPSGWISNNNLDASY